MAGRAGRRGLDKLGTVIYLPQRKPAFAEEVKAMMTGSTQAISSRMDFHYDFILKVLQSGSLNCLSVMRDSYWYKQRLVLKNILTKELRQLETDRVKTRGPLTDSDLDELLEKGRLEDALKTSVNAAKKEAQRALGQWNNRHVGPRWENGAKALPILKRIDAAIVQKSRDIAASDQIVNFVEPRLIFLEQTGYITAGPIETLGPGNLTLKGILATEVNESHSLLTAEIYTKDLLAACSGEEILCVLAAFIAERLDSETHIPISQLNIPDTIINHLKQIEGLAAKFSELEQSYGIVYDGHWAVSTQWIEPVWRWLAGEPAQVICSEYGIYAGNLMRIVLRIANIADEWIALATYCEHTEMVGRMTAVKEQILRDIAVTDSLYLRI
jgi:superfamily II RNA helicase